MANELYEAVQKVCEELPEGYEITIRMENGAGWIELETPNGTVDIDSTETLEEGVLVALQYALDEAGE